MPRPPALSGVRLPINCPKLPKFAAFLDEAEADVPAYMTFPAQRRPAARSRANCMDLQKNLLVLMLVFPVSVRQILSYIQILR
jgi:hypothetical protein